MIKFPRVVIVGGRSPGDLSCLAHLLRRDDLRFHVMDLPRAAAELKIDSFAAAVVIVDEATLRDQQAVLSEVLELATAAQAGVVVVAEENVVEAARAGCSGEATAVLGWNVEGQFLTGWVLGLAHMGFVVDRLGRENGMLTRVEQQVRKISEMDEEMRLAGRLQMDFLPRKLPRCNDCEFQILFRPAGYVSGDIYDAMRLDENHLGFYVADAMGHGMPAALLTMFIKRALRTKDIFDKGYRIIPPDEALGHLNGEIVNQQLSLGHFATMVYCVVDTRTLVMQFARAGHPCPLLINGETARPLSCSGALLGAFADEQFALETVQLEPGDHILLYTDGFEFTGGDAPGTASEEYMRGFGLLAGRNTREKFRELGRQLDTEAGSLHPQDDITALMFSAPAPAGAEAQPSAPILSEPALA